MSIQNGRKPLSTKPRAQAPMNMEDLFGNSLSVPDELRIELEKQNLAWRFISAPDLQKMGGYHRFGWRPYQKSQSDKMSGDVQFGNDPNGYIRRGELVLATRPMDIHKKHQQFLKQEADRAKLIQQTKAGEIRDLVGSNRGIQVHEGYEDEGEEVTD